MTLADQLRRRRFHLGHNQREAAAAIGVSPDTLQRWEADGVLPAPGILDAVETYLGLCFVRWTRGIDRRLKAWRKDRGLDQRQAAAQLGACLQTVTKVERGRLSTSALVVRGRVFDAIGDGRKRGIESVPRMAVDDTATAMSGFARAEQRCPRPTTTATAS